LKKHEHFTEKISRRYCGGYFSGTQSKPFFKHSKWDRTRVQACCLDVELPGWWSG